ncbi:MAG TPA: hypothetical protein VGM88_29630 [Kofleriaceae bacterium]|jgi:hypothetical protein
MRTLAFHIDHRLEPGRDANIAAAVGEILARPCFAILSRAAIHVKDRDKQHQLKTAESVAACLLEPDSDAVVCDNGRRGELVASAEIWTGRHTANYADPKPLLASSLIIPYEPAHLSEVVESFVALVATLQGVAGYATIEDDYSRAHKAALSAVTDPSDVLRARERKGHFWHDKRVSTEISGPDWGLVLGPAHLEKLVLDPAIFPIVRSAGASKVVFVSVAPEDAAARLDAARSALGALLMDVSAVPAS